MRHSCMSSSYLLSILPPPKILVFSLQVCQGQILPLFICGSKACFKASFTKSCCTSPRVMSANAQHTASLFLSAVFPPLAADTLTHISAVSLSYLALSHHLFLLYPLVLAASLLCCTLVCSLVPWCLGMTAVLQYNALPQIELSIWRKNIEWHIFVPLI